MKWTSAGSGTCAECDKAGTLSRCLNCDLTMCFSCWQDAGGFSKPCPQCGVSNKKLTGLKYLRK